MRRRELRVLSHLEREGEAGEAPAEHSCALLRSLPQPLHVVLPIKQIGNQHLMRQKDAEGPESAVGTSPLPFDWLQDELRYYGSVAMQYRWSTVRM